MITARPISGCTTHESGFRSTWLRSRRYWASTEMLTKANAVNAPKLMNDVDVVTLRPRASSPTAPVSRRLNDAGFGARGAIAEIGIERQLEMIEVNVAALTQLTA